MAVLEVKMVSGWAPEKHSLKQVSPISTAIFESCTLIFNQNSIASQNFTWFSLLIRLLFVGTHAHVRTYTNVHVVAHTTRTKCQYFYSQYVYLQATLFYRQHLQRRILHACHCVDPCSKLISKYGRFVCALDKLFISIGWMPLQRGMYQ